MDTINTQILSTIRMIEQDNFISLKFSLIYVVGSCQHHPGAPIFHEGYKVRILFLSYKLHAYLKHFFKGWHSWFMKKELYSGKLDQRLLDALP